MSDVAQEMMRIARQAADNSAIPIAQRLDMAPWNDGVCYGGIPHKDEWWGGGVATATDKPTFRCSQTSANTVMVYAGCVRHHGFGATWTTDTEITLSGAEYVWIYVNQNRDTLYASILQSTDEPTSDTNTIRVPLTQWHRTGTEESPVYELVLTAHKHDIHFANPLT